MNLKLFLGLEYLFMIIGRFAMQGLCDLLPFAHGSTCLKKTPCECVSSYSFQKCFVKKMQILNNVFTLHRGNFRCSTQTHISLKLCVDSIIVHGLFPLIMCMILSVLLIVTRSKIFLLLQTQEQYVADRY